MATPSNKPRDIKNLKARLGRTITPGQAGLPSPSAPPGGSVPPPAVGGGLKTPPVGSVPPPSFPGMPNRASRPPVPTATPFPGSQGIVAPPFARPGAAAPASKPAAPAAAAHAPRVDPFAAASPAAVAAAKKVTLIIDDSAVKEDEIGRKSRTRSIMLVSVGALLGIAVGFGVGNTADKRHQYGMAVRDGKAIYAKIQEVSKNVDAARTLVKRAVGASSGGPGRKATIDYDALEQLVAMKRPLSANEFHRRLYRAFGDGVVDDLFDYYNNVNLLWDGFTAIGARTAGKNKRETLDKSAAAADGLLNTEYGMVLTKSGDMFGGGLVFVTIPPQGAAADEGGDKKDKKDKKDDDSAPKVKVASSQGGMEVERTVYMGQEGLAEEYDKYVFMVDKVRSRTILGEAANLFGKYRADLMELDMRVDKTGETQGRLLKALGQVASLPE